MADRYEWLYLMPEFVERLQEMALQKPSMRGAATRVLQQFGVDCKSMQRSKLKGAKRDVWRTKIDGGARAIDEPLPLPSSCAVLYIDKHDDALAWGEAYSGDTVERINSSKVMQVSTVRIEERMEVAFTVPQKGAPDERPDAVAGVANEVAAACEPDPPASAVEDAFTPAGLDTSVIEMSVRPGSDTVPRNLPRAPVPGYEQPAAIAVHVEDIPYLLRMPLKRFLATLSDEQKDLARRENRNLYVVRGAAGSGKTVIGIRRVEFLLRSSGLFDTKPILVMCYNRVLKHAIEEMLEDTLGTSLTSVNVEVRTAHELLRGIEKEYGLDRRARKKKSNTELLPLVARVRSELPEARPIRQWLDSDVLAEIDDVVIGRAITTREQYIAADRSGRGRMEPGGREAIWHVYQGFRRACDDAGVESWSMLPARVEYFLKRHPPREPRYAGVVIDEVQDLHPAAVRAVLALQAGSLENVLLLGDAAQSVYRAGFRWKHYGIQAFGGQFSTIRRCYRSTEPIIRAATPLLRGQRDSFEDDLVLPEVGSASEAPLVHVQLLPSVEACIEETALAVASRVEQEVPRSTIAVLVDNEQLRKRLCRELRDYNIACDELYENNRRFELGRESVKLLTTYAAKGLEFQVVFLPLVTESAFPTQDVSALTAARSRRHLYTAMLRSGWELVLHAPQDDAAACLGELDQVFVRSN